MAVRRVFRRIVIILTGTSVPLEKEFGNELGLSGLRNMKERFPGPRRLAQRRSTPEFLFALLSWMTCITAQEYLPPKVGGGGGGGGVGSKKLIPEPTLPANYDFSYDVQDNSVSLDFGHNEKRKDDRATGSYHVLLPDGRMQLVEYEAGPEGYKPQIMYMGTATFPGTNSDKFDGYHYNAASNRQTVRQAAPRASARQGGALPAPPPAPAPPALPSLSGNTTQ